MTILTPITEAQNLLLNSDNQRSELSLAFTENPPVVFQCVVNQTFPTHDQVHQFTYDTPTGNIEDVIPGMTVWIGSVGNPLHYDMGQARVRKSITEDTFYIGEGSEIAWADNLQITVVDEMLIWPKHVYIDDDGEVFMDRDIAYTNQHEVFQPCPIMGCNAVLDVQTIGNELVQNGDFTHNLEGWTKGLGTVITRVSGGMKLERNGSVFDYVFQNVNTVAGMIYNFSVQIISFSHTFQVLVGGVEVLNTSDGVGTHYLEFEATSSMTAVVFVVGGDANAEILVDNVSLSFYQMKVRFDAQRSWVFGSTIASYAWTATEGTFDDPTSATPILTISEYPSNGQIRVALTLTSAAGGVSTGYRYVKVYDPDNRPVTVFKLDTPVHGEYQTGGFSYEVTFYTDATRAQVRDRAPIVLFSKDYYGNTAAHIGQHENRDNIVCTGWAAGETITYMPKDGTVTFVVEGAHYWIGKMNSYPPGVVMANRQPDTWTLMTALTVDRGLWHFLRYRTTVVEILDVTLTGDTRYADKMASPKASIWAQIVEMATTSIMATGGFDPYGRLFISIDPQMVPVDDRDFVVIQDFQYEEWQDRIDISREVVSQVAQIYFSGVAVSIGGQGKAYASLSPGHVFKKHGDILQIERMLVASQGQCNGMCGLLSGWKNNQYPKITIRLAQNNRMFTLFPPQYGHLAITEPDTERGIDRSLNLVPRSVSLSFDEDTGVAHTEITFEAETFPELSTNGNIPGIIETDDYVDPPTITEITPPTPIVILPPTQPNYNHPREVMIWSSNFGVLYTGTFDKSGSDVIWIPMNVGIPEDELTGIFNVEVTPAGALYAHIYKKVYRAPYLGAAWSLLYEAQPDGTIQRINSIGVNPFESDTIAICQSGQWADTPGPFLLSIGGVVGSPTANTVFKEEAYGAAVFADNKWYTFGDIYGFFSTPWTAVYSAEGDAIYNGSVFTAGGQDASGRHAISLGTTGVVLQWDNSAPGGFNRITDDGSSVIRKTSLTPHARQGMAFSPVGVIGMGSDRNTVSYLSIDGGETWTSVAGVIPMGIRYWDDCGDDNRFVFAGGTVVRFTSDLGDSYFEKTGNLGWVAPLISISGIRFIA